MSYTLNSREPIKVIGDIIAGQLCLISSGSDSQIMLAYERFDIPPNDALYIALSYLDSKLIGNNNYFDGNAVLEIQQAVLLYRIQIDVMSFGPEARERKEEIMMALRSIQAQSAMEKNNLQVARMPASFADASSLEESKMLNRFTTTINVTALTTKTLDATSTYDSFPFQFDENTAGRSPILNPEEPFS